MQPHWMPDNVETDRPSAARIAPTSPSTSSALSSTNPCTPSVMISHAPFCFVLITGTPIASASSTTRLHGSCRVGNTKKSDSR